ncbi:MULTISPECIES: hypothetical protein [unclassified Streptomyces]|uniref:hypothetical protein n=1 Tax=unclassified Streptomyces TaxID=2593676 RepID=UPI000BAC7C34|nr:MULTISPECIES: hypothetical protein [unclassified Streptomyces]MYX22170.1 hypothetical protein [Streptomyces sp. SID8380]
MTTALPAQCTVLKRFPAGHPRGSWPADEYAAAQRAQGTNARVVMDLTSDQFLVVTDTTAH